MSTQRAARKNSPDHRLKTVAILGGIGGLLLTAGLVVGEIVIGRSLPVAREASVATPQLQPALRKVKSGG